jgi:hypothetical protein
VAIEDEAQVDAQKSDTWKCEQPLGKNDKMGTLLVGGLEPWNFMTFHSVGNVIIPYIGW